MKDLITVIAKALVDYPDEVRVNVVENDASKVYELSVHPSDVARSSANKDASPKPFVR